MVDKPFCKVLLKELTWDVEHCHYCHQKKCGFGIPCPHCVFAFYCDEHCLRQAWEKFHRYECKCAPYLHLLKSPRTVLLALRIICTVGPESLRQLFLSQERLSVESKGMVLGSDEAGVYDSTSYVPIFHLISHPSKLDNSEMISYCMTSLSLVSILENNSTFFNLNYTQSFAKGMFQNFVASLILLHMQNLPCNAHSLNELTGLMEINATPDIIRTAVCDEYGAGAFALLSLINHSCDPNVHRVNLYSGQTAVVTIRGLKAGEEVLDNYGAHFALEGIVQRKKHLQENYYFDCGCVACSHKWPLYAELKEWPDTFICPNCNYFTLLDKFKREYLEKCALPNNQTHCKLCGGESSMKRIADLNMMIDQFICAYNTVLQNKPLKGFDRLTECLTYFENNLLPPYIKTNDTQETLKQALNLIVNFTDFEV